MLALQQKLFRPSTVTIKFLRAGSNTTSDDINWSSGEKQKPVSWRHTLENWYKIPNHEIHPHNLDPNDPKQQYPYKLPDGGIQYFNFVYYPRNPDHKEPEIEPTKLFFVYRRKPLKHRPYWEKNIMKKLGLDAHKGGQVAVVKNIPEMNAMLWQVKHLITIKPLKFPENLPEDRDPLHYFIQENGEVLYKPSVKVKEEDLKEVLTEIDRDPKWVNEQTRIIYDTDLKLEF